MRLRPQSRPERGYGTGGSWRRNTTVLLVTVAKHRVASAETVLTAIQQRTAEQLFRPLGELKGGAMTFGQALSVLEAALPEVIAGPYRAQLTRLQDAAPPLPLS